MAANFSCPGCGNPVTVHWSAPGTVVQCRACGSDVTVPGGTSRASQVVKKGPEARGTAPETRPDPRARFAALIERLEQESVASPAAYQLRIALLGVLGYGFLF